MQDLNDKITGSDLTASEWNQVPSEIQNVIEGLGQTLSGADLNQLGKGIAGYVANGYFYTDSGAADAYVLTEIGSKQAPTAYTDGFRGVFRAGNANTGASTVNFATLGVKNIFFDGAALIGGEIVAGAIVTLIYDLANGRFDLIPELSNLYSDGTKIGIGIVPVTYSLHLHELSSGTVLMQFTNSATGTASNDGAAVGINAVEQLDIWQFENLDTRFGTNNTPRIIIAGDGGIYTNSATGASQGADTINASAYYVDGVELIIPSTATNFLGGQVIQIEDDTGAVSPPTDIGATVAASTWESVGPTGSGADNIYTGMNNIPASAKFMIARLRAVVFGSTNTDTYSLRTYVRVTGSSTGLSSNNLMSEPQMVNRSGSSEVTADSTILIVPLDSSRRFDIHYVVAGTSPTVQLTLIPLGFIE